MDMLRKILDLWTYVASQNNDSLKGDKIEIFASDLPDNVTVEELNL